MDFEFKRKKTNKLEENSVENDEELFDEESKDGDSFFEMENNKNAFFSELLDNSIKKKEINIRNKILEATKINNVNNNVTSVYEKVENLVSKKKKKKNSKIVTKPESEPSDYEFEKGFYKIIILKYVLDNYKISLKLN